MWRVVRVTEQERERSYQSPADQGESPWWQLVKRPVNLPGLALLVVAWTGYAGLTTGLSYVEAFGATLAVTILVYGLLFVGEYWINRGGSRA